MPDEIYISIEEVAKRLGVGERTVEKYVRLGKIKAVKNPVSGSIVGFTEEALKELLTGKPAMPKQEDSASPDAELAEIKRKTDIAKAEGELELVSRRLKDFKEFDVLKSELESERDKVTKKIIEMDSREREINTKEKDIADRETAVVVGEENIKRELLSARERIAKVDEEHKKVREAEDRARGERHSKELSTLDRLAQLLYNAHPQSISNRVKEQAVQHLKMLMLAYGLVPQFDVRGAYIPLEDRAGVVGIEVKSSGRNTSVEQNGSLSNGARESLKICLGIYSMLYQDSDGIGGQFCRNCHKLLGELREMVENKGDDEIAENMERIMSLLGSLNQAIMQVAESYQRSKKEDWTDWVDYLCVQSAKIYGLMGTTGGEE